MKYGPPHPDLIYRRWLWRKVRCTSVKAPQCRKLSDSVLTSALVSTPFGCLRSILRRSSTLCCLCCGLSVVSRCLQWSGGANVLWFNFVNTDQSICFTHLGDLLCKYFPTICKILFNSVSHPLLPKCPSAQILCCLSPHLLRPIMLPSPIYPPSRFLIHRQVNDSIYFYCAKVWLLICLYSLENRFRLLE